MAQRVEGLPAMQKTWVRSLGQEDPLEKEIAIHSSTLAWKISPWDRKESDTTKRLHFHFHNFNTFALNLEQIRL